MNIIDLFKSIFIPKNIFQQYPIGSKVRFIQGEFAANKYEGIVATHGYICDTHDCLGIDIDISPTKFYRNYPVTNSSFIVRID